MLTLHMFLLLHVLTCLGQNAFGNEIINGHKAKKNSMQYMAYLEGDGRCGGFLISEDFLMTAAHCDGMKTVVLGTHDLTKIDKNTMIYGVEKECKHPYFDKEAGKKNDIMLLKLSRKARVGKKRIKPVKLPTKNQKPLKANQMCTVAGWGATETGTNADELQVVDVPIISMEQCQTLKPGLPPAVICAGGYNTTKGTCTGDSGGPLVCKGVAVGIVSFGPIKCDYPGQPDVYTNISKFLPWINDILKKKDCVG